MKKQKKLRYILIKNTFINIILILFASLIVVGFFQHMQRQFSIKKQNKAAQGILDTIGETLDKNRREVELLVQHYHENNFSVLNDTVVFFHTDAIERQTEVLDQESRGHAMLQLSNAIGEDSYLFVIDKKGTLVDAPESDSIGTNLVENQTLTQEQLEILTEKTYTDASFGGDSEMVYILTTIEGLYKKVYIYSLPISDDYYLLYGVDARILDKQIASLKNLEPILSEICVGESGFVFALDPDDGTFKYYNDGNQSLSGKNYSEYGLQDSILEDNYTGIQIINGCSYYCVARKYKSSFYGENIIISAARTEEEVFRLDITTVGLTVLVFLICAFIFLTYATMMRLDPDYIVGYDENLGDRDSFSLRYLKAEHGRIMRNVYLGKIMGKDIYYKLGIARNLSPVFLIAIVLIGFVSWNSLTLSTLTEASSQSNVAITQLQKTMKKRNNSSNLILNYYEDQYYSKARLLSYVLKKSPDVVFNQTFGEEGTDSLHTYIDQEYEELKYENGSPVRSIQNSSVLQEFCEANGLDSVYIYDDHGRTIATNTEYWYFTLNEDPESQSYPFHSIIRGENDCYSQEMMVDEHGDTVQYIGISFYYYTLEGTGPDKGAYVSENAYLTYTDEGRFRYKERDYSVKKHRSLLQLGLSDERIASITKATSLETLMRQVKVGTDGFVVVFDNSSEHVCLWSPYASSIGKTAEEMNLSENTFSGIFKGFTHVNGVRYFQQYVFIDDYWIATAIPTDSIYVGRMEITLITMAVVALFFLLIGLICTFSSGTVEEEIEQRLEKKINQTPNNGMVKVVMPSGKIKYARSAVARYDSSADRWVNYTTTQKISEITRWIVYAVMLMLMVIYLFADKLLGENSSLAYIAKGEWEHSLNYFAYAGFFFFLVMVFVISTFCRMILGMIVENMGTRVETIGRLLLSVVKYGSVIFGIFQGLSLLGFSSAGLITSAGILSIIIGLGSQSLISDIVAGIFIVFEGEFRVGDIVTIAGTRGRVVDIGLRTTKIECVGDIQIFNNSSISGVLNMTKQASNVFCSVYIDYDESIERVEMILKDNFPTIRLKYPNLIEGPVYLGVDLLDENGIKIKIMATCTEEDRIPMGRALNRELLLLLQENHISIPFSQVTVSYRDADGK